MQCKYSKEIDLYYSIIHFFCVIIKILCSFKKDLFIWTHSLTQASHLVAASKSVKFKRHFILKIESRSGAGSLLVLENSFFEFLDIIQDFVSPHAVPIHFIGMFKNMNMDLLQFRANLFPFIEKIEIFIFQNVIPINFPCF